MAFLDLPSQQVYIKRDWLGEWEAVDHFWAERVQWTVAPGISTATLIWRYGRGMRGRSTVTPGDDEFVNVLPLGEETLDRFVRIVFTWPGNQTKSWYGIIKEEVTERRSESSGVQYFQAFGLEYLLATSYITSAIVENHQIGALHPVTLRIGRGLAFNDDVDSRAVVPRGIGNRSSQPLDDGRYVFASGRSGDEDRWLVADAVEYLLNANRPGGEDSLLRWKLGPGTREYLSWPAPPTPTDGRSLKQVLDSLIDRRRLVGYYITVEEPEVGGGGRPEIVLQAFSFTDKVIRAPGDAGDEFPILPNERQIQMLFDLSHSPTGPLIRTTRVSKYDRVVCRGGRLSSVFSLSPRAGTLVPDWSQADEEAYSLGGLLSPGYNDLLPREKAGLNAQVRNSQRLQQVYRYFRIPDDWNGLNRIPLQFGSGNWISGRPAFPSLIGDDQQLPRDLDPETLESQPYWLKGIRFEHVLLGLREGNNGDTPRRPMCFYSSRVQPEYEGLRWFDLRQPVAAETSGLFSTGSPSMSGGLEMRKDAPGVVINIYDARRGNQLLGQHAMAGPRFAPVDSWLEAEPVVDFEKWLVVTVCALTDEYAMGIYPERDDEDSVFLNNRDPIQELVIDFGDRFRCEYIAPGTVIGLDEEQRLQFHPGGLVRDDRRELKMWAKLAWHWYSRDRKAMQITLRDVSILEEIGTYVTSVGEPGHRQFIDSVITSVTFTMPESPPDTPLQVTTEITTDYAELDVRGL